MKTLGSIMVSALALSSLFGCAAQSGSATPPVTSAPAPVVVVGGQEAHGLSVLGRGEVTAAPDTAFVEVGVETDGATVSAARSSGAKAMKAVLDSALRSGVARADIQTSQLTVDPKYAPDSRIVGYTMRTSVTIRARDLDKLGALVDAAVQAGGNASRVSGIRFSVEDAAALRDRAREAAIKDARRKVEQMARVSGARLGALLAIEEVAVQTQPFPYLTGEAADAQRTPIERGQTTVAVELRARWSISG